MERILVGFFSAIVATVIAFIFLVVVAVKHDPDKNANAKLLRAALAAFLTMLGFIVFFMANVEGVFSFSDDHYAWLGPVWIIGAIVVALLVSGAGKYTADD